MNWYEIFYWVTVADGVKSFFDVASNVFTWFAGISGAIFVIAALSYADARGNYKITQGSEDDNSWKFWIKSFRRVAVWCTIFSLITWMGFIFCPNKRDALAIIAGGAVGNFIMNDSSAKQIPAELTLLVREKLRSEIQDLKTGISLDTLKEKTKEELIELLKQKK